MENESQLNRVSSIYNVERFHSCFSSWMAPYPREQTSQSVKGFKGFDFLKNLMDRAEPPVSEYECSVRGIGSYVIEWMLKRASSELEEETVAHPLAPDFEFDSDLQAFLSGRLLLMKECQPFFTLELLLDHFKAGYLSIEPGITCYHGRPRCHRCGNSTTYRFARHACARCGLECLYCRECLEMGQVKACTPLLRWVGPQPDPQVGLVKLDWEGTLTSEQKVASSKLWDSVLAGKDFLLWAVCGAGKTEVLYETIQRLIENGKRVALATPRTDVIIELERRFSAVFPEVPRCRRS